MKLLNKSFLDGSDGEGSACNAGDPSSIPGLGRSPREGNGNPLQYSCLKNSMERGAWWATGYSPWGHKESATTGVINTFTVVKKKKSKFYKCSYLGALSPLTGYFPPPSPGSHLQVAVTLSESQVLSQVQLSFSGCSQMSPNHITHNLRQGGSPRDKALSLNLFWVQTFPFYFF